MGCFNVACSFSKMPIRYGDRVVFIPLKIDYLFKYDPVQKLIRGDTSLIYPHDYYNPLTLPIMGEYNDYGSICEIERDENIEVIENYFKMCIEDFLDREKKPKDVHAGMFINRKVYDFIINREVETTWREKLTKEYLENQFDSLVNGIDTMELKIKYIHDRIHNKGYEYGSVEVSKLFDELNKLRQHQNIFHYLVFTLDYIAEHLIDFTILRFGFRDLSVHYGPSFYPGQDITYDEMIEFYEKNILIIKKMKECSDWGL